MVAITSGMTWAQVNTTINAAPLLSTFNWETGKWY